mmetsp:Transcript_7307/g.11517  ORF Transcript_7307/g.11517 Transcript_7307/m.11517 type:complete len:238 (+) Transcript_7307:1704-2417(+)
MLIVPDRTHLIKVFLLALRCLGNMLAYSDKFNEKVISDCGGKHILDCLAFCMKHQHRGLRKEAIWVVGNILAGPPSHKKAVVDAGFLPQLVDILQKSQFDLRKEAVYALFNVASQLHILSILVEKHEIIPSILDLIKIDDVDLIKICLMFTEVILASNKKFVSMVEEAGGIEALETVQTHPNTELWDHAGPVVDKYWGEDAYDDSDQDEKSREQDILQQQPIEYPPWRLGAHQNMEK